MSDLEKQLYIDIADLVEKVPKLETEIAGLNSIVPSLPKEIQSLKTRLTKLSNRVDSLELMAFQEQISRLDEKITAISDRLKQQEALNDEMVKATALSKFDFVNRDFLGILDSNQLSNSRHLRTQLFADIAKTRQLIRTGQQPVDELKSFTEKWNAILKNAGANWIRA